MNLCLYVIQKVINMFLAFPKWLTWLVFYIFWLTKQVGVTDMSKIVLTRMRQMCALFSPESVSVSDSPVPAEEIEPYETGLDPDSLEQLWATSFDPSPNRPPLAGRLSRVGLPLTSLVYEYFKGKRDLNLRVLTAFGRTASNHIIRS